MAQLGSKYIQNRAFMDHLGKQLGFHEMDDWYQINQRSIKKGGGDYLLSLYQGSPVKLVQAMYPEHDWLLWKFQMVPKGYWALQQNQRQFLDWLGIQLGFKDLEDWYRLHQKDLIDHGGYTLLSRFHGSPSQLLQSVYPDHVWLLWKFKEAPNGYWKNKEVQKKFMDHLGKDLGFKSMEDWYQLKARNMISKGGAALLGQYNNSPSKLLQSIYPQHSWSLRKVTPKGHWDKVGSQKEFLDWLGRELGFTEMDHWYSLKDRDILDRGGSAIFQKYKGSVSKLLSSVYFEHSWEFWRFETVPKGFWNDLKNHKDFVDWLGKQLGIGSMEGWYNVTFKDIVNKGGATIMYRYYHDSPSTMLRTIYPNHEWLLWKFKMVPKGFWNGIEETELKKFVPWLQRELKVSSLEGWYRISMERISEVVSLEAFAKISLEQMLQRIYPNHEWDVFKFENYKTIKAAQQRLLLAVKEIFPDSEMVENFQLEEIRRNKSSRPIELDVFLPKERLALEYQGEQHYIDLYALGNRWYQKQRDDEKRAACSERSITLIEVPYWWKFNISSLMATIYKARPDLVPDCGSEPISDSPLGEFSGIKIPYLMQGENWDGHQDLSGWWMSEKMDGVRAHWNGKEILSKQSKKIPCPFWFMEGLSKDRAFDGELWMGRGSYEKVMSTLIAKSNAESWKDMKYVIFDLPQSPDPYEIRIKELKTIEFPSHVTAVESALCFENSQMLKRLEELVKNGGEGLMMNNPHSTYIKGRSNAILKVKMYDECEVQLLEITSSGLFCQQTNGVESMVGCYQQVIHNPPPIGSVLTVKHNGFYQKGLLKNPVFWRHRPDIEWTEISISKKSLVPLLVLFLFSQTENANWTNREKSKEFFEALKIQLNYKTLDDFYGISVEEIGNHGGKALLENMFEGSLVKVLHYAYPDHKWLPWKFRQKAAKGYWDQVENQFAFVDWLGRELNFKCLNDWYKVTRKAFKENGGVTLLEYNSTPSKILKQVYPEHLWLVWKFDEVPRRFWDKKENQKEFLDWLEIHLSFQTKEDWYNLKQTDIITEGGKSLLDRHGSISQLVRSIYPDHTWQQDKFLKEKTGYWIADQ